MICLPRINDELCRIEAGFTLLSETASSLSYKTLNIAPSHDMTGICLFVSASFPQVAGQGWRHTGIRNIRKALRNVCNRTSIAVVEDEN